MQNDINEITAPGMFCCCDCQTLENQHLVRHARDRIDRIDRELCRYDLNAGGARSDRSPSNVAPRPAVLLSNHCHVVQYSLM